MLNDCCQPIGNLSCSHDQDASHTIPTSSFSCHNLITPLTDTAVPSLVATSFVSMGNHPLLVRRQKDGCLPNPEPAVDPYMMWKPPQIPLSALWLLAECPLMTNKSKMSWGHFRYLLPVTWPGDALSSPLLIWEEFGSYRTPSCR